MNEINKTKYAFAEQACNDKLLDLKTYHIPCLIEYGDLRNLTRGGGKGKESDSYSNADNGFFVFSNIHA